MTEHEEQYGAGLRDRFERLYTPHRMAYIRGEASSDECPFCVIPKLPDEEGLIVARGTTSYAVLNLFPYNSGHLMLVPYRHVSGYDELTTDEANEIAQLTQRAIRAVRHASGAHGFNVGMNLGTVAGTIITVWPPTRHLPRGLYRQKWP
jgi:ATP adenylyltransferase